MTESGEPLAAAGKVINRCKRARWSVSAHPAYRR